MKTVIAIAVAASLTITVTPANAQSPVWDDFCSAFGELAGIVMDQRQQNVPLSEMIARSNTVDESIREGARLLVLNAYSRPVYSTEEFRQRAVTEFRNEVELFCYSEQ